MGAPVTPLTPSTLSSMPDRREERLSNAFFALNGGEPLDEKSIIPVARVVRGPKWDSANASKGGKAQVPRKQETKQDAPAQKPDPRSLIAGMPEGPMKEAALKEIARVEQERS